MRIKPGGVRPSLDVVQDIVMPFPMSDAVATDGVQYSAIATFGTTAVNILSHLIDPGFTMQLQKLEVGLSQRFTGLNASLVSSINYYWTAQPVYNTPDGTLIAGTVINITGTYQKAVGTITTSDDVFSGDVPVGSVPYAPVLMTLKAIGIQAAVCQGKVKNSSYVRLVGNVIPGA